MDEKKEGKLLRNNKIFQKTVGYAIVIGIAVLIVAGVLFYQNFGRQEKGKYAEDIKSGVLYHVVSVLDGDTLVASVAGHDLTVRLIGMDTPEVVDPRKPVQCYGPEASKKAKELLLDKSIYLERETDRESYDKYGRVLAYARFSDGSFYNQYMVESGFAREYTFNKEKYKYQTEFKEAQKTAQASKIGLWSACPI